MLLLEIIFFFQEIVCYDFAPVLKTTLYDTLYIFFYRIDTSHAAASVATIRFGIKCEVFFCCCEFPSKKNTRSHNEIRNETH